MLSCTVRTCFVRVFLYVCNPVSNALYKSTLQTILHPESTSIYQPGIDHRYMIPYTVPCTCIDTDTRPAESPACSPSFSPPFSFLQALLYSYIHPPFSLTFFTSLSLLLTFSCSVLFLTGFNPSTILPRSADSVWIPFCVFSLSLLA